MYCPLGSVLCEKQSAQGWLFYEQTRSNGTHKNKLKSSFPCTCDRITAVRRLNCLTQKLKICIFVPSSLRVCFFSCDLNKISLPLHPFQFKPEIDIIGGDTCSGGSAGFGFISRERGGGKEEDV